VHPKHLCRPLSLIVKVFGSNPKVQT